MRVSLLNIFEGFQEYASLSSSDKASLWIEIALVLLVFAGMITVLAMSAVRTKLLILCSCFFATILLSLFLGMYLLSIALLIVFMWILGVIAIVYSKNLRKKMEGLFNINKTGNAISKEDKDTLISTLAKTAEYLSKRNIGALITIERDDSLSSIIEKSISIDGNVSQELLTTIFTEGTACHDGAVIIRGNKIMCAAAYLPSTDKYDLPKSLGTRHRAAIGLSERYDALTIIVSEETGYISYTIDGNIQSNVTIDALIEELNSIIKIAK